MQTERFLHIRAAYYGGPKFVLTEKRTGRNFGSTITVSVEFQATTITWNKLTESKFLAQIVIPIILDELNSKMR